MKAPNQPSAGTGPRISLSGAQLVHMNALWFGLAYLWNGLHSILLPAMLIGLVPSPIKNTALGVLTFFGLMVAMLVQPVAGALSDRGELLGRWGKRRPWMALGTTIDVVFLALLILVDNFWLVALAYVGLQIASSLAEAALQGLLPDVVPPTQRGRASGFKNAAQIAGFVAGVALGGLLASQGHLGWALMLTAVVLLATALWNCIGVREKPAQGQRTTRFRSVVAHAFRFDKDLVPGYKRLLAGRALLMGGYFALQGFAQYFVADELRVEDPVGTTALLMATMGAAIFLLAIPTGVLADRMGRRPLNLAAGVIGVLATLALVFVGNVPQLILAGGMVGVSAGVFLSVNWAWAADLVPAAEAGRYLGLSNLATAGSSAFARLLSGPIVDAGNAVYLGLGFNVLFVLLAVAMAVGTWILAGVPETKTVGIAPVEVAIPQEHLD